MCERPTLATPPLAIESYRCFTACHPTRRMQMLALVHRRLLQCPYLSQLCFGSVADAPSLWQRVASKCIGLEGTYVCRAYKSHVRRIDNMPPVACLQNEPADQGFSRLGSQCKIASVANKATASCTDC